jgi:hypothetical protein
MKGRVLLASIVLIFAVATTAQSQSNFESSKLSSGIVTAGVGFQSSKVSPGVVVQGSGFQSSKLSPGIVTQNTAFQSSKLSVGIVVQVLSSSGVVPRAPLTHW